VFAVQCEWKYLPNIHCTDSRAPFRFQIVTARIQLKVSLPHWAHWRKLTKVCDRHLTNEPIRTDMPSRRGHTMQTYRLAALMLATLVPVISGCGAQAKTFSVLYSFRSTPDGGFPDAALINVGGTLYGTTGEGGANNYGSVFAITPAGVETVIYSFKGSRSGPDGDGPDSSLINVDGALYGTTVAGGSDMDCGTVFKVTPAGAETVLHVFCSSQNDGAAPLAGLINVGGTLYGTTESGGTGDRGTVFKMTRAGKLTVLHSFGATGDGQYPEAGLINVDGTLYGTTFEGGASGLGTVFKITQAGVESVVYAFKDGTDAAYPEASLLNVGGTLYGTAVGGGANLCDHGNYSCGAVFKISPSAQETVLYSFKGKPDANTPSAGLINVNGPLYGTTSGGGNSRNCGGEGCGTIFKLAPTGVETIVHSLSSDDGIRPNASLLKLGHALYGTASGRGSGGGGTVFTVRHH
jgi:uncharacterized repeat protein (TIGR03803 family)